VCVQGHGGWQIERRVNIRLDVEMVDLGQIELIDEPADGV